MTQSLSPLLLEPILIPTLWGNEIWTLALTDSHTSRITGGNWHGQSLNDLLHAFGEQLTGRHVQQRFPNRFPLLIKFIDARDDLSIQVHPNDQMAKQKHNASGKTEMWFVVHAEPHATLFAGFNRPIQPNEYAQHVADGSIQTILQQYHPKDGDVFFLPAGQPHAAGKGCLLAEIQQNSNITYRISDYNRRDRNNRPRKLHTALAQQAIDYTFQPNACLIPYTPLPNQPVPLVDCRHFVTQLLSLSKPLTRNLQPLDSCVAYTCTNGLASLSDHQGNRITLQPQHTLLVPASIPLITLSPLSPHPATLLETHLP